MASRSGALKRTCAMSSILIVLICVFLCCRASWHRGAARAGEGPRARGGALPPANPAGAQEEFGGIAARVSPRLMPAQNRVHRAQQGADEQRNHGVELGGVEPETARRDRA